MYCFRVLKICECLSKDDLIYLSNEYDFIQNSFIICTTYLDYLTKLLQSKDRVCIHGPKGVGKSFSLVYLMCCPDLRGTFVLLSPEICEESLLNYLEALERKHSQLHM